MSILSGIGAALGGKIVVNIARRIARDYKLKKSSYMEGWQDGMAGKSPKYGGWKN